MVAVTVGVAMGMRCFRRCHQMLGLHLQSNSSNKFEIASLRRGATVGSVNTTHVSKTCRSFFVNFVNRAALNPIMNTFFYSQDCKCKLI
jgi:hypothetical protein